MRLVQYFITRNDCWVANETAADSRYHIFQKYGPKKLMLHSVGCAQSSGLVFANKWNQPDYQACAHAVIDANDGTVYQTLKWNYRGWHCGGSGNNTHVGVEMCESKWIRYITGAKFEIRDKTRALADCTRAYHAAVELFAMLCSEYKLDPLKDICSHKEGAKMGIASGHVDPEHYWTGLGTNYTMDGFRKDVQALMKKQEKEVDVALTDADKKQIKNDIEAMRRDILSEVNEIVPNAIEEAIGKHVVHVDDIKNDGIRKALRKLVDEGWINGGTTKEEDPDDIRLPNDMVRMIAILTYYIDDKFTKLENKILFRSEE